MKKIILLKIALFLIIAPKISMAQVVDIDSNSYKTVTINNQNWMAENLNVSRFNNGDIIPQVQDINKWNKLKTPAWCYYENNSGESKTYGKLYNWYAISDNRGLAPEGWHIPSDNEFKSLSDYLGGDMISGEKLKANTGWKGYLGTNANGTNESGFNCIGAGGTSIIGFSNKDYVGSFWTTTITDLKSPLYWSVNGDAKYFMKQFADAVNGYSVRCLKN